MLIGITFYIFSITVAHIVIVCKLTDSECLTGRHDDDLLTE